MFQVKMDYYMKGARYYYSKDIKKAKRFYRKNYVHIMYNCHNWLKVNYYALLLYLEPTANQIFEESWRNFKHNYTQKFIYPALKKRAVK